MSNKPPTNRKRVACVYHNMPHYRAAVNEELAANSEHEWTFYACTNSIVSSIKLWQPPAHVSFVNTPILMLGPLMIQFGLIRAALGKYDTLVMLGNAMWPMTWLAAILGRLTGKQVLFWSHGWIRPETGLKAKFRATFYRLAHGMMLYGHVAKVLGIAQGFKPDRLHVIYNSLDYEEQKRVRKNVNNAVIEAKRKAMFQDPSLPIACCVTRLIPVRRIDQIIEALEHLLVREDGEKQRWNLLLVGDGPERENLEKLSARSEIDICFAGACYDPQELATYVMASNVTVAPGKIGLSAMTGLAFGTPVVTHGDPWNQMPEWESIIDGKSGSFFELGNIPDLANAIGKWKAKGPNSEHLREDCYAIMDRFYNPAFQRRVIDRAISGQQANDIFWHYGSD